MARDLRVTVLPPPTRLIVQIYQRTRGTTLILKPRTVRVVQVARPVSGATVAAAVAAVSALIEALGIDAIDGLRAALDARATPADIASAVAAAVAELKGSAGPAYDTFRELQDLIVADETALSTLAGLVARKANAVDVAMAISAANSRSITNALIFG